MAKTPWLLLVLALAGCGPGYENRPLTKLTSDGLPGVHNDNPRTESFEQATPMLVTNERTRQAPYSAPSESSSIKARTGTTGPSVVDADGCFVGLAISGGGLRSANFAAGCMFQLERLGMLQKVDCISAVSGGSLVGTYYCICSDQEWNPDNLQHILTHHFSSDIVIDAFLPWNFWNLVLGTLTRSDLLAARFDERLFIHRNHKLTFGDLRPDRTRLLINTTDLETGRRFTFDNSSFDELNSNLSQFPLSYAVAASSAIPILMPPVSLRDFSTEFEQYYHLVDGGVSDNLGVQSLVESYEAQIQKEVNPYPHGAILIVIDAGTPVNTRLTIQPVLGGLQSVITGLGLSSSVLLNRASSATMAEVIVLHSQGSYTAEELRGFMDQLHTNHYVEVKDSKGNLVRVIHLSLTEIPEMTTAGFGTSISSIDTNFDIDKNDAYALYKAAEILFREKFDAKIKPLVEELNNDAQAATTRADN